MLEKEKLPVAAVDERVGTDQEMKAAIEQNDVIGFSALTPNIRRAIAWAKYAKEKGKITIMGGPHASVDQGIFLDSGHFDYVLKGEAEETLPQFLQGAVGGGDDDASRRSRASRAMRDGELWVDNPRRR
jgi:anaerobic magnesium-protoporphyrin IX monomethyl ester cyclase